jgi:large exoprotein involved in heme utilization and adhesion
MQLNTSTKILVIIKSCIALVPSGDSGSLTINTPALKLIQDSIISVENQGTGNAGTISIDAEDLNLDDTGSITATAASGEGGNIVINTRSLTAKKTVM